MNVEFEKYHGTGNDFIIIDLIKYDFKVETLQKYFENMASRRFGIGADGIICIQKTDGYDFKMLYYNADGNESSMCGNGGRCIIKYAHDNGYIDNKCEFLAIDGPHEGRIEQLISLKMSNVNHIKKDDDAFVMNTGSPHYVIFKEEVDKIDVKKEGQSIRNNTKYKLEGINVNFVAFNDQVLKVRTYERGVEDETFSCGTGVTAAAISYSQKFNTIEIPLIETLGGPLKIRLNRINANQYEDIWLEGPAVKTFEGNYII